MQGGPAQSVSSLLIHLGGLGDVCLSESTLLSLRNRFGPVFEAVGTKRVLDVFGSYFSRVDSIDSRAWAYLFCPALPGGKRERIVFIGKDRAGSLRQRLAALSPEVIFIDMYPDGGSAHVEDYQLGQLASHGIAPVTREQPLSTGRRVILYPERGHEKRKWPVDRFLGLYEALKGLGIVAVLMRPPDLALPGAAGHAFGSLADVEAFFAHGGYFFSCDSGMAHFAARCGLRPLTLFSDTDPLVWHPRGALVLRGKGDAPTVGQAADFIARALESQAGTGCF